jgi:hypothetical protein
MTVPDFEQIVAAIFERLNRLDGNSEESDDEIRAALRQVWNARGAADATAVEDRLATLTGWVTSEPYRQHLREAIAAVDCTV